MADNGNDKFPHLNESSWLLLRKKFKSSLPTNVNAQYIMASLNVKETSAKSVYIPTLKRLGLIDGTGKPTDLAKEWRSDETYKKACIEILNNIYPIELLEAQPPDQYNYEMVKEWFFKHGVGEKHARKQANLYRLLCDANLNYENGDYNGSSKIPRNHSNKNNKSKNKVINEHANSSNTQNTPTKVEIKNNVPIQHNLHIDLHVHIPPESTLEQIEKIFEGMGKYLYNNSLN